MKKLFSMGVTIAVFAGCATEDPYGNRGGTGAGTTEVEQRTIDWGGTPGTHPNDPGGNTEADEADRARPGVSVDEFNRTPLEPER